MATMPPPPPDDLDLFYGKVSLGRISQISGERLQDNWSSGLSHVPLKTKLENLACNLSQKVFEILCAIYLKRYLS